MNIRREQLVDIIQLAKVMIDNHKEEVEGNPSIVALVKDLADKDANELVVE